MSNGDQRELRNVIRRMSPIYTFGSQLRPSPPDVAVWIPDHSSKRRETETGPDLLRQACPLSRFWLVRPMMLLPLPYQSSRGPGRP
jgi:hypothetical protein